MDFYRKAVKFPSGTISAEGHLGYFKSRQAGLTEHRFFGTIRYVSSGEVSKWS